MTADNTVTVSEQSFDPTARSIYLFGRIDESFVQVAIPSLHAIDGAGDGPIDVYLMTDGGEISCALAVHDAIKSARNVVRIHAIGDVLSSGVVVFVAGDDRIAYPHTSVMLHRPYTTGSRQGSTTDDHAGVRTYLVEQERRIQRALDAAGCGLSFGSSVSDLTGEVWIHGGSRIVRSGLAHRLG